MGDLNDGDPTVAAGAARRSGRLRGLVDWAAPKGISRGALVTMVRDARVNYPTRTRPGQDLRVLVVAPPKSGNHWVKCLLAHAYGLAWIHEHGLSGPPAVALRALADRGEFKPGSICHVHYPYSADLVAVARSIPCQLVTIIRDPYDQFVSLYYHLQEFPEAHRRRGAPAAAMIGQPLDHPDVLHYLDRHFGQIIRKALGWVESGESAVVRYEALHHDPVAELTRLTAALRPVDLADIEGAIPACTAEKMRQFTSNMPRIVRSATVGDSRQRLGPEHLAIFRDRYAKQIRALGYEVR